MPGWIGPWELAIIFVVVLLFFGPKRLPQLGRSLGKGARELKDALTARHDRDDDDDEAKAIPVATTAAPPASKRNSVG